jgi:hypothetical protein
LKRSVAVVIPFMLVVIIVVTPFFYACGGGGGNGSGGSPNAPTPTPAYNGTYRGTLSGTTTINGHTVPANLNLVLVVQNNNLVTTSLDNGSGPQVFQTPAAITDSIPGISQIISWGIPQPGGCPFRLTGTFRAGTALGDTASGTWSYDPGACSGGGVWQTNT